MHRLTLFENTLPRISRSPFGKGNTRFYRASEAKEVGRTEDRWRFSMSTALIRSAHMLAPPPGSEMWYARPVTLHSTSNSFAFFCKKREGRWDDNG